MDKLQRNERIGILMKLLTDSPGKIFTLGNFTEIIGSAKSTISEDIDIIQDILDKFDLGMIVSIPGASGGIKFIPSISSEKADFITRNLCEELSQKERILPGGFVYMLDIIYNPVKIENIARIFTRQFYKKDVDYVITVETKGIPLAFATARFLNVPLIIVRHYNEATDGASVNINYVSGSKKKLQTMVLSLKSLKRNSKLLFIDDFMKGGGTAKGIMELAKEFECEVSGIGVLIKTAEPDRKLVDNYFSILTLDTVDEENGIINIRSSR
ncbi:pur operon repressor [Pseudobacteroides cellulosolvens]|uniref:Purine operon repressor, PurR n=1 Tax=Pseudobacteroides cellulosolvens ATCC 35603 = DSM 2933 TaxID=398512 RepID=A0A0L6JNL6_9FIRM|nr:pur operon repressor [Pseudobacteroides cellulosolvens]KNY27325.1 purine operon repressor, PurR [Pseudobacteroides cellulosolvens ATCC 35603 = DSM 2933]